MIVAPTEVRSGLPPSGPQTLKSKFGTPSAERSMPKTSQMTPNSKIARPSSTSVDTLLIAMAAFYRKVSFLPLLAGSLLAEYYCHDHCTHLPDPDRPLRGGSGAQLGRPSLRFLATAHRPIPDGRSHVGPVLRGRSRRLPRGT